MNKVFHIALESEFYRSEGISRALSGNCYQFNWQRVRYEYGIDTMRRMALSQAETFKPDLIFFHCQLPDAFDVETIKSLQAIAPVVNFTFDVRQDIMWHKTIAPLITLTVFACNEDVRDCIASGIPNVAYLPASADFEHYKQMLHLDGKANRHDIVFIGNNNIGTTLVYPLAQQRRDMVEHMYEQFPDNFMAYGLGQKGGLVHPDKEIAIYNNAKIAITHNHFMRSGYCSDRDWRAVGCGPLVIHHAFPGVHDLFGKSAIVWSDKEDLMYECKYFLKNMYERLSLSQRERDYVFANHTWEKRFKQLYKILDNMYSTA